MQRTPTCPHKPTCALFPLFSRENLLRNWQIAYCDGNYGDCARFQRSTSGDVVPDNLLPNGTLLPVPGRRDR
jgi:hypothetical protein